MSYIGTQSEVLYDILYMYCQKTFRTDPPEGLNGFLITNMEQIEKTRKKGDTFEVLNKRVLDRVIPALDKKMQNGNNENNNVNSGNSEVDQIDQIDQRLKQLMEARQQVVPINKTPLPVSEKIIPKHSKTEEPDKPEESEQPPEEKFVSNSEFLEKSDVHREIISIEKKQENENIILKSETKQSEENNKKKFKKQIIHFDDLCSKNLKGLQNVVSIRLLDMDVLFSDYNVTEGAIIQIENAWSFTIPVGNYTIDQFVSELNKGSESIRGASKLTMEWGYSETWKQFWVSNKSLDDIKLVVFDPLKDILGYNKYMVLPAQKDQILFPRQEGLTTEPRYLLVSLTTNHGTFAHGMSCSDSRQVFTKVTRHGPILVTADIPKQDITELTFEFYNRLGNKYCFRDVPVVTTLEFIMEM